MTFARLTSSMKTIYNEQMLATYKSVQEHVGLRAVQEELAETSKYSSNHDYPSFFNRFQSWLSYFNPNTSTNSYRTVLIGPLISFIGRAFNFAGDHDCNVIAELFSNRKQNPSARPVNTLLTQRQTWVAMIKMVLSFPGATVRQLAVLVDFTVDSIFSPIRFMHNLNAAFANRDAFFDHLFRQYQMISPRNKPRYVNNSSSDISLNTITLNTGLLRNVYWGNNDYLNHTRRPRIRAHEIAKDLLDKSDDCDVICLQEVFDNWAYFGFGEDAQSILIDALRELFPYGVYDVGHKSWPLVNSGLVILSKYPILEVEYYRFSNLREVEIFSNKGFVGVKIEKCGRFFTVYNIHAQSPLVNLPTHWLEWISKKQAPDALSTCRGKQLGCVHEHFRQWGQKPVKKAPHLKYGDTIVMGDTNQNLYSPNKVYGISNGKKKIETRGTVKHPGQNRLMRDLSPHLADNFVVSSHIGLENTEQQVKLAKSQLVLKLKKIPDFQAFTQDELEHYVNDNFVMMSGSWVLCRLSGENQDLHSRRPNYDICFSADFDKPDQLAKRGLQAGTRSCLLFYPQLKGKEFYSDHAGMRTTFRYGIINSM